MPHSALQWHTGLPKLEWLSLQGCTALSAAGLRHLQRCRRLKHLDLSGTNVVGLGFLEVTDPPRKLDGVMKQGNCFRAHTAKAKRHPIVALLRCCIYCCLIKHALHNAC